MSDRRKDIERSPLSTFVTQLRESCEASARLYAGTTCYAEEVALFRTEAEREGFVLDQASERLSRFTVPPTAEGNEHQVWFAEEEASFYKLSWPGHFGLRVVYRRDEERLASPIDYLERWDLHNELFGDSVEFLGVVETDEGMRMLIRQPAIEGVVASKKEIDEFFSYSGWQRIEVDGNAAYYENEKRVLISDTHRGNIIRMANGFLAPIDLRVEKLTPSLVEIVQKLSEKEPSKDLENE